MRNYIQVKEIDGTNVVINEDSITHYYGSGTRDGNNYTEVILTRGLVRVDLPLEQFNSIIKRISKL